MILDTLDVATAYGGLTPRFATAFAWLAAFSPETPDGRVDLEGDDLYALVQSYGTVSPDQKAYESHRAYADIQFVAAGAEVIYYAPISSLRPTTAYDPDKDCVLYADPPVGTPLHLGPGTMAIFLPHDGHKPGCSNGQRCEMKKVVVKVRL
jgi:biofilm protein TabA